MTTSSFPTTQYPSTHFIESAGCILFYSPSSTIPALPTTRIALLHYLPKDEILLPKGRLNVSEPRSTAALRETAEETGIPCQLLSISLESRATPAFAPETGTETEAAGVGGRDAADIVRTYETSEQPFYLTIRTVKEGEVKLIWWFVAIVDEEAWERYAQEPRRTFELVGEESTEWRFASPEEKFEVVMLSCEDAVERLTFEEDREVVRRALEIVGRMSTQ